mgnify:CR=1 FL=1
MRNTHPFDDDHVREECGVFGIYGSGDAAAYSALGLHALQHRGQEAAGIVSTGNGQFRVHRELGLVGDIFSKENVIKQLEGTMAIGHTRYSTKGRPSLRNVQPLLADVEFIAIDGLYRAMDAEGRDPSAPAFCDAFFSSDYPIQLTDLDDGATGRQLSLLAEIA